MTGSLRSVAFEPDPENYRKDVSPRGMAVPVFFAAVIVAFATTAMGQRWLAVDPVVVVVCFAVYVAIYGTNVYLMARGELLMRPSWWPARALGCSAASAFGCVFAAGSSFDASPGWVLHLVIGMATGLAVRPTRWMLAVLLIPALGIRVAFVPDATLQSFLVLGSAVLGAYVLYSRTSTLMLRERNYGARARAARSIAEETESLSAAFQAAMTLHDGLSGSLMVLRHRLKVADSPDEARSLARAWLGRARSFVHRPADDTRIELELERFARSLGVPLKLDSQISEQRLAPAERTDLYWIASELVANSAAHDPQGELCLRIRGGEAGVSMETNVSSQRVPRSRQGRGLRNVELRALGHGGEITFAPGGLRVAWRRVKPLEQLVARAGVELILVVGAFCVLLRFIEWRPGPFVVVVASVLFVIVALWDRFARARRAERQWKDAELRRLAAEEGELLRLAGEALAPSVRRAEDALASDIEQLASALDEVSLELRDLLWSLEWTGDVDALRAELGDFARQASVAPPEVPELAVRSARGRWALLLDIRKRAREGREEGASAEPEERAARVAGSSGS